MSAQEMTQEHYRQLSDEEREVVRAQALLSFVEEKVAQEKATPAKSPSPVAKPLSKAQLLSALAAEMGGDKKLAMSALEALARVVTQQVAIGGAVSLPGLGKFYSRVRPARDVRNPATGETIHKDADRVVKVTVAKALKDAPHT